MSDTPFVAQKEEDSVVVQPSGRWPRWLVLLVVFAIIGLLGWGLSNQEEGPLVVGEPAPTFAIEYLTGYEWGEEQASSSSLEAYQGKIVVLNFWASWCVPCHDEAEILENAWLTYKDQDVVFLGLAYADTQSKSLDFLKDYNITYPNAPDLGRDASYAYQTTGVPETFFIDAEGNLAKIVAGPLTEEELINTIEQLLEK